MHSTPPAHVPTHCGHPPPIHRLGQPTPQQRPTPPPRRLLMRPMLGATQTTPQTLPMTLRPLKHQTMMMATTPQPPAPPPPHPPLLAARPLPPLAALRPQTWQLPLMKTTATTVTIATCGAARPLLLLRCAAHSKQAALHSRCMRHHAAAARLNAGLCRLHLRVFHRCCCYCICTNHCTAFHTAKCQNASRGDGSGAGRDDSGGDGRRGGT